MKANEVQLRELTEADIPLIAKLANNDKIWQNLTDRFPRNYTIKDAKEFLETIKQNEQKNTFAITFNNEFCGVISLVPQQDIYKKSAELGYWIGEPFWGKGIVTKAIKIITKYGFENLDIVRIFAKTFDFNIGSMRVLEKNGYIRESIEKKGAYKNGKIIDVHVFVKLIEQ